MLIDELGALKERIVIGNDGGLLGTDHMADHAGLRHAAADDAGQIEHLPGRKVNDDAAKTGLGVIG